MDYNLTIKEETQQVTINDAENTLKAAIGEKQYEVDYSLVSDRQIHFTLNGQGKSVFIMDQPDGKIISIDGVAYFVQDADALAQSTTKKSSQSELPTEITPVTPSVVVSVLVKDGDIVEKGQGVIVLSAMKMETTLNAPFKGTVTSINTAEGEKVSPGDILVNIEKDENNQDDDSESQRSERCQIKN